MAIPEIKICGVNTPAALDAAVRHRTDYLGFVFFAKSPRNVSPADAAALSARLAGRAKAVGLFVDADDAVIAEAVAAAKLDVLQLHGKETPERAAALRARFGLPVWKALSVASREDVARAAIYAGAADLVLFDAKAPKGANLPGGLGLTFDWSLLSGFRALIAWGLAGGLAPENVAEAIRETGAPLVDVSSGVESTPGVKDEARIAAFALAVRGLPG
ncbi:phosphoribosylanthranilate isomerase [Novosphingobium sp. KCTC 2891]|uniref:phosphoribosylanthranilate isomerase n=1 Tax=Novosphingobium sp. KCTC 2891 TaxID=2989730 RepID=UPI002223CCEF|nr:phosphoribosylanthranilate isomerase [Novosphingobium sp. KCTC 2891]MCW1384460.1 phosphoribosylanthranilate isomerase [Novosphingobium sp. KCTC 2891]